MRILSALLAIAAAVAGVAFFADHPGRVSIVWQGWEIETSVGVLAGAAVLIMLLASTLALLVAALRRVAGNVRRNRAARRRRSGEAALTRGIVALAAGDVAEARLAAARAEALLDDAPVALLLAAEAATRQDDAAAARRAYAALLARPQTEFLGLRGLIGQALRAADHQTARRLAERARRLRPEARWLIDSLLVLEARAGDWAAARDTLASAARRRALSAAEARHRQGVVLYQLSLAAERRGETRQAAGLAAKAQVMAADLAAPACHHARLLRHLGRKRAAAKAIERGWRYAPHPDLARLYLELAPEAAPLARAAALQRLVAQNPEAAESHLAIAEAALAAELWGEARRHLGLAIATAPPPGPSRRLCLLMARLEEGEGGDAVAARRWRDRALTAPPDRCYVCGQCGHQGDEWSALCVQCDGFDTLAWRTPPDRHALAPATSPESAPLMLAAPEGPRQGRLGLSASSLARPAQSDM